MLCASLVAYTWLGYPALLFCFARLVNKKPRARNAREPSFSIIVAVHNEEAQIAAKLEDLLRLDYPCIEILVASDGSTDRTDSIAEQFAASDARIKLVRTAGRAGKSGAQNLAAAQAQGEILLFTDASTRMQPDLLCRVAESFADERVGLLSAVVNFGAFDDAVSQGQRAYWTLEVFLRQLESDLGLLATASGQAFCLRRELFRAIPPEFGDDCVVPLDVRLQGFRVVQAPEAVVRDEMPHDAGGELRARVRMTARNWGGILDRPAVLNPFRFPGTAWALLSHKLLRWLTPVFLVSMLGANVLLALNNQLQWLLATQSCFYAAAAAGCWEPLRNRAQRVCGYPFAFCLANTGFFLGTLRRLQGAVVVAYK